MGGAAWLAAARGMGNERFGAAFVGRMMCRLRKRPRMRWGSPHAVQLLGDVRKVNSLPVEPNDFGVSERLSRMGWIPW
jgi:hypothetical protein